MSPLAECYGHVASFLRTRDLGTASGIRHMPDGARIISRRARLCQVKRAFQKSDVESVANARLRIVDKQC